MTTKQMHFTMKVRNSNAGPATPTIEPWGDQTPVAAGGVAQLACAGPEGGLVEIVVEPEGITVYGWPGSVIEVVSQE